MSADRGAEPTSAGSATSACTSKDIRPRKAAAGTKRRGMTGGGSADGGGGAGSASAEEAPPKKFNGKGKVGEAGSGG